MPLCYANALRERKTVGKFSLRLVTGCTGDLAVCTDALFEIAPPQSLFNNLADPSGFTSADPLAGAPLLDPGQSTGLGSFSSNQIGRGVGGLIGGGLAGGVASQLIQGGGPQPPGPPSLPANLGPLPGAPPNLQNLVVRTGGGLPQTLEELLRRR